jgi:acyl-ACP thioesterase
MKLCFEQTITNQYNYKGKSMSEITKNCTLKDEGKFNIHHYSENINSQVEYVEEKKQHLEKKLTSLKNKEDIVNMMITRTGNQIDKYFDEKNFKMVSVQQGHLTTQFETMSLIQDIVIKYENMVQSYIKMRIDIENHKINAYVKIKNADKAIEKDDTGYNKIMEAVHNMTNDKTGTISNVDMNATIEEKLKLKGY